jgi:general secretion pathway protein H
MPTSVPGSKQAGRTLAHRARPAHRVRHSGFTLIELLLVLAIVAISVGVVALTLRDSQAAKLDEEAVRLATLFELARAESRASGAPVRWAPVTLAVEAGVQFRFVGLPASQALPVRWLDSQTRAEVVGAQAVVLGPEAILPAQRVVLRLGDKRVDIVSDGLAPFAAVTPFASVSPVPLGTAAP